MKKLIQNIHFRRESKSFVDCLHAIVTAAGIWKGPKYRLSGMTGMVFKFSVHQKLHPMSVTAYGGWVAEHFPAVNNIGIASTIEAGHTRHPTFPLYKAAAIQSIKQSIDDGVGAIFWEPEFCIIHGYDDDDQVFYYLDGTKSEMKVMLYQNFGLNITPYWYFHILHGNVNLEITDIYLNSFILAVNEWETPFKSLPDKNIASGKMAYQYLIDAISSGEYDAHGGAYILTSAIQSKKEVVEYISEVEQIYPEIRSTLNHYRRTSEIFSEIGIIIEKRTISSLVELSQVPRLLGKISDAADSEEKAIQALQIFLAKHKDNVRLAIPRWGSSSPR
jgi:hypothetical protein